MSMSVTSNLHADDERTFGPVGKDQMIQQVINSCKDVVNNKKKMVNKMQLGVAKWCLLKYQYHKTTYPNNKTQLGI